MGRSSCWCMRDSCEHCWPAPRSYLFGLVEVWPDGGWSMWCPVWAQPLVFWIIRRIG